MRLRDRVARAWRAVLRVTPLNMSPPATGGVRLLTLGLMIPTKKRFSAGKRNKAADFVFFVSKALRPTAVYGSISFYFEYRTLAAE